MCRETMPNSLFMVSMSGDWIVVSNRLTRWVGGLFKTQVWVLVHGLALHLILKPKWAEMVAIVAALFLRVTTDWGAFLLPANPDLTGIWRMGGLTCFSIFASSLRLIWFTRYHNLKSPFEDNLLEMVWRKIFQMVTNHQATICIMLLSFAHFLALRVYMI